jgi:hypothetical protein
MEENVEEVTFEEKITLFKRIKTLYESVKKVTDNINMPSPKEEVITDS